MIYPIFDVCVLQGLAIGSQNINSFCWTVQIFLQIKWVLFVLGHPVYMIQGHLS